MHSRNLYLFMESVSGRRFNGGILACSNACRLQLFMNLSMTTYVAGLPVMNIAPRYVIIIFIPIMREEYYSCYFGVCTFILKFDRKEQCACYYRSKLGCQWQMLMWLMVTTRFSTRKHHQQLIYLSIVTYDDNTGIDSGAANQVKDQVTCVLIS